ncbi:hypothetical protein BGZ79_006051 [Entomortierella chlamydospora]|nr:hypothetical protein BGZ79_006051 [Entomortierella chlamydospora]
MSTVKPGLTAPFIPPDSASSSTASTPKASRSRKQRSSNSNHQKKLEKSPSFNSNLHNGLNNTNPSTSGGAGVSASTSSSSNSVADNSSNVNTNSGGGGGGSRPSRGKNTTNNGRRSSFTVSENNSEATVSSASNATTERSRGYLPSRPAAKRLGQDSSSRKDNSSNGSGRPAGSTGRLFDPKKDPVPVVPSTSVSQQSYSRFGSAETRSPNPSSRKRMSSGQQQQQNHRLYDPNQPQPQSVRQDGTAFAPTSTSVAAAVLSQPSTKQSSVSSTTTTPSPMDGLVKLTKEIQQLEKKVMEKPTRRTLDSDDDMGSTSRQSGSLTWNRRMDNSKRLALKYLKLMQADFKSSLKHDIDTRCWRLAIYPLIEAFRAALRNSDVSCSSGSQSLSESDDDQKEDTRHYFTEFIGFAQEFYETLKATLQKLEAKHATPNGGLSRSTPPPRWHRCIGIMGDLARYRWLHKLDDDASPPTDWLVVARRLYREAIDLGPCNGKMYNQLALLSGGRGLESLYYYSKSLTVRSSFMNARDTLTSFFAANEQIRNIQNLSLKLNAKARQAAIANATLKDCEGSFLLLHAMLFEKINLDVFEKRFRNFSKQLKSLHMQGARSGYSEDMEMQPIQPERWDGFYFMLAITNIAAVYEFNWSASVIAKSNTAFGKLTDHLATVATLPYSSKLLLSTMEQAMQRYLASVGESQRKVASSSLEEQQGWLVYCHAVLVWMAGRPFGYGGDMTANWLMMADHESMPTFWTTLTTFMNYLWNQMTPFDQSDMLSAISEEMSENTAAEQSQELSQEKILFKLSLPPLGHEWELRGLAWLPTSRFGSEMFKDSRPVLDNMELKGDCLWKQESLKMEQLKKRLIELSHVAAMHMEIIEYDFCENAFKISDAYVAQVEDAANSISHSKSHLTMQATLSTEEYSTDDNFLSSHASVSQDSGIEDDEVALFSSDGMDYSTAEIMELKSKRDQLKSLLSESNANGRQSVSLGSLQRDYRSRSGATSFASGGYGKNGKSSSRYGDRRNQTQGEQRSSQHLRGATVAENSTLVIDTNCLIADWTLIQRLVAADRWTVIIPLAVITELDGLKNNPAPLGPAASGALNYLEGCLAMRPKPRRLKIQTSRGNYMNDLSFRVESFNYEKQPQYQPQYKKTASSGGGGGGASYHEERDEEEYDGDEEIMRNHNVDDFILGLCLWHQENASTASTPVGSPSMGSSGKQAGQGIYLVTDDRNLRVKARARSVEVLGKEDLAWMTTANSPR